MTDPLPLPLLLDGATATNLIEMGMPIDTCPEEWMLDNQDCVVRLHEEFINAGSELLYTPTYNTNREKLAEYGLEDKLVRFNKELAQLTKAVAGSKLAAGCLSSINHEAQPFGDMTFAEIVDVYAEQAFALKEGGVDLLVCDSLTSMAQCRAAILGCRQTGLPVMVTVSIDTDGDTMAGSDALACLIAAQSLGACAFGLSCCNGPAGMKPFLEEMIPYARIPLIAKPNAGMGTNYLEPEEMAAQIKPLMDLGVQIIGGCCHSTYKHIEAMKKLMDSYDFSQVSPERDNDTILMCCDTEAYFLDEMFEMSDGIHCRNDMSDELLELEHSGVDVACILIDSIDDAEMFAENAHMLRMPVAFLSDDEQALEAALRMYNGRAFIDSRSALDEQRLYRLAERYGSVVR
ncbi:MAG: homocysteine S-methyltransferase family protein [Oscillospiraceae bacterium]|nr:homocysteine S-methyltransferase family protein [Oscillospiraceae bacterium]